MIAVTSPERVVAAPPKPTVTALRRRAAQVVRTELFSMDGRLPGHAEILRELFALEPHPAGGV